MVVDGESESIVKEKSSISNTCVRERESFWWGPQNCLDLRQSAL